MTARKPKVGDTVKCDCGCDGTPFVVAAIAGDRAESADGMRSAYVSKCVVVRPAPGRSEVAPVAKKATAAELRNKARMSMPCVCEDYCRCDVTTVVDDDALDAIIAAARAEAVAPVMDVLRQLASAWAVRCQCITCDSHREPNPARRIDPSLRAALALLAADQGEADND